MKIKGWIFEGDLTAPMPGHLVIVYPEQNFQGTRIPVTVLVHEPGKKEANITEATFGKEPEGWPGERNAGLDPVLRGIVNKFSDGQITVKDHLLWKDGRCLDTLEADMEARKRGFFCAERRCQR